MIGFADDGGSRVAEEQRNAPHRRKSHKDIDYPADHARLTAADEADEVELKNTDAAPVETADHKQRQRDFVNDHHFDVLLPPGISGAYT